MGQRIEDNTGNVDFYENNTTAGLLATAFVDEDGNFTNPADTTLPAPTNVFPLMLLMRLRLHT